MTNLSKGETWHDPNVGMDFEVKEDVDVFGMSHREMDKLYVEIEFEDGEELTVPHERFRGNATYEYVGE